MKNFAGIDKFTKPLAGVFAASILGASVGIFSTTSALAAGHVGLPKMVTLAEPANAISDPMLSAEMNRGKLVAGMLTRWKGEIADSKVSNFKAELAGLRVDQLVAASNAGKFDDVLDILDGQAKSSNRPSAVSSLQGGVANQSKAIGDVNKDLAYTPLAPCRLFNTIAGQTSALGQLGGAFAPNSLRNIVPAGACGIPAAGVKDLFVTFTTLNNTVNSGGFLSMVQTGTPINTQVDIFNIGTQYSSGSAIVPTGDAGQFDVYVAAANAHVIVDILGYFTNPTSGNMTNSVAGGNVFTATNTNTASFSTALRGVSTSNGFGGIGVWGSHAASGFGVYGTAGAGGYGVYAQAGAGGYGVYANANGPADGYGVFSNGKLGVATSSVLDFGSQTRQMIQLWGGTDKYGIGVQSGTQYYRTDGNAFAGGTGGFAWFEGGTHSDTAFDAGAGGTALMYLTRGPSLVIPAESDQQIKLRANSGLQSGIGAQAFTAYMRTNGGIAFYTGGVHSASQNDPGTGGSVLATIQSGVGSATVTGNVRALGFTATSDRASKTDFASVNAKSILAKVASLPISTWKYIAEQGMGVRHIGPVAQDFMKAFNVGYDDKSISSIDASGVALTAIKGLSEIVQEKDARISSLEKELAAIKKKLGM
jgi:Chaperone of endosialidase